jgi:hypothetical protein
VPDDLLHIERTIYSISDTGDSLERRNAVSLKSFTKLQWSTARGTKLSNSTGPTFDFEGEAVKIVDKAKTSNLTLRVLGATAFRIHSPNNIKVHDQMARAISDLDFMGYSKDRDKIERFFTEQLGYDMVRAALTPGLFADRCIFINKSGGNSHADVFLDKLAMNHVIDFKGRLDVDYPTISLVDLLLEKLQIVHINEKDIKDSILLLLEHDVGQGDKETINMDRIVKIMSEDWGFYYTSTTNLKKIQAFLPKFGNLTEEQRQVIDSRIVKLLQAIENQPKKMGWKLRAKVGPSKKWYNDVEEVERAEHLVNDGS